MNCGCRAESSRRTGDRLGPTCPSPLCGAVASLPRPIRPSWPNRRTRGAHPNPLPHQTKKPRRCGAFSSRRRRDRLGPSWPSPLRGAVASLPRPIGPSWPNRRTGGSHPNPLPHQTKKPRWCGAFSSRRRRDRLGPSWPSPLRGAVASLPRPIGPPWPNRRTVGSHPNPLPHQTKKPRWCGAFSFGGEGGIRTLEGRKPQHAFQACALNRSATSP